MDTRIVRTWGGRKDCWNMWWLRALLNMRKQAHALQIKRIPSNSGRCWGITLLSVFSGLVAVRSVSQYCPSYVCLIFILFLILFHVSYLYTHVARLVGGNCLPRVRLWKDFFFNRKDSAEFFSSFSSVNFRRIPESLKMDLCPLEKNDSFEYSTVSSVAFLP